MAWQVNPPPALVLKVMAAIAGVVAVGSGLFIAYTYDTNSGATFKEVMQEWKTGSGYGVWFGKTGGITASGAIATKNLSAASCTNASTSKIYATGTGMLVCGTDQDSGTWPIIQPIADNRYVNTSGDTMTGDLLVKHANLTASGGTFTEFISTTGFADFLGISNPDSPAAGTARFHAATTQGFTRFEQDNEGKRNVVLGRDNVFIGKNTTGGVIGTGSVVYVTGSTGNVPNIAKAKADSLTTLPAVGMAMDSIAINGFGQIMKLGVIQNVDTSAFSTADRLWVSATTAGELTATRPAYPNFAQHVGSVLVDGAGNGSYSVFIAPYIGGEETGTNSNFTTPGALSGAQLYVSGLPKMRRGIGIPLCDSATACAAGSGVTFRIPNLLAGFTLSGATLDASVAGVGQTMKVNIYNQGGNCYVFTTPVMLGTTLQSSDQSATGSVINPSCRVFASGQRLVPQITNVNLTPAKGVTLTLDLIP